MTRLHLVSYAALCPRRRSTFVGEQFLLYCLTLRNNYTYTGTRLANGNPEKIFLVFLKDGVFHA